jgi:hypothetical protein
MDGAIQSIMWDGLRLEVSFRTVARRHQGVCIRIYEGDREALRFDCYDDAAHYHYDPGGRNQRFWREPVLHAEPVDWALELIQGHLPQMLAASGAARYAPPSTAVMAALRSAAESVDRLCRQVLIHYPGDFLTPAGPITFGLRYDEDGDGVALRILRTRDGEFEELLGFDCFGLDPHYHYGPRRKNVVIGLDVAVTGDPLEWALSVFRGGRLPYLLARAGYPEVGVAVAISPEVGTVLAREVEPLARRLQRQGLCMEVVA